MLKCPKCNTMIQLFFPVNKEPDIANMSRNGKFIKCGECEYSGDPLDFDPRSKLPKVVECYITTGGMVIAFDGRDQQVRECQGFILMVADELKIRCDEKTKWYFGKRDAWLEDADFSWWFKKLKE